MSVRERDGDDRGDRGTTGGAAGRLRVDGVAAGGFERQVVSVDASRCHRRSRTCGRSSPRARRPTRRCRCSTGRASIAAAWALALTELSIADVAANCRSAPVASTTAACVDPGGGVDIATTPTDERSGDREVRRVANAREGLRREASPLLAGIVASTTMLVRSARRRR